MKQRRAWITALCVTAMALLATGLLWRCGVALRETVFGKHLGVAALPGLAIVLLWAPGLIVNALLGSVSPVFRIPVIRWLVAFACGVVTWTPVTLRLTAWFRRDVSARFIVLGGLLFAWVLVSLVAIDQERDWAGWAQLTTLLVVVATYGILLLRTIPRRRAPPNSALHQSARAVHGV